MSQTTASVLARRGYADPVEAKRFLEAELPAHDPLELGDMAAACDAIRAAIAAGTKICVHGDYDADGICATALAVLILRDLGAEVNWHLPSRFDEGYGVGRETLTRLAGEGVGLVLTVDCGVTAVDEVEVAAERLRVRAEQRLAQLPDDAGPAQLAEWVVAAVRTDHRARRELRAGPVMVGDDHVEPFLAPSSDLLHRGYAAVDREHEANAVPSQTREGLT